jgi:hypothetical protein
MTPIQGETNDALRDKQLVFLVGAPRSGTTWLQLLLSRSPSVVTAPETHLFNAFLRSMVDQWNNFQNYSRSTGTEIGLTALLSDEEFRALLRTVSGFVFAKIAQRKLSATVILEKSPPHVHCWREILDLWPDAHFIHIIRDPRSVIASLRAASKTWGSQWASSRISTNCESWIWDVTDGRRIASATRNYQEVTFEGLISDGPGVLTRLLSGLGVRSSPDECRRYVDECGIDNLRVGNLDNAPFDWARRGEGSFFRLGTTDGWRVELSTWEIALVECLAGPLMSELGFKPAIDNKAVSALVGMAWTAWGAARAAKRRIRCLAPRHLLVPASLRRF